MRRYLYYKRTIGASMEKVRLGRTNLIVTKLGWGGIPIQRVDEREAVSVIRAMIEMGVDLLDTARAYTNSEHRVGLALQRAGRPVILSSKSTVRSSKTYNDVLESLKQMKVKKSIFITCTASPALKNMKRLWLPEGATKG